MIEKWHSPASTRSIGFVFGTDEGDQQTPEPLIITV